MLSAPASVPPARSHTSSLITSTSALPQPSPSRHGEGGSRLGDRFDDGSGVHWERHRHSTERTEAISLSERETLGVRSSGGNVREGHQNAETRLGHSSDVVPSEDVSYNTEPTLSLDHRLPCKVRSDDSSSGRTPEDYHFLFPNPPVVPSQRGTVPSGPQVPTTVLNSKESRGSGVPAAPSSSLPSSTTRTSPSPLQGLSHGGAKHDVAAPFSEAEVSAADPLSVLSPEQVEVALLLYMERGGVFREDVPNALRTLPWYQAGTTVPGAEVPDSVWSCKREKREDDDNDAPLNPAEWLSAVAATVTSRTAVLDAQINSTAPSSASPAQPKLLGHDQNSSLRSPRSAQSGPHHVERTAKKRLSPSGLSDATASAADASVGGRSPRHLRRRSSQSSMTEVVEADEVEPVVSRGRASGYARNSIDRKLAFDEADGEEEEEGNGKSRLSSRAIRMTPAQSVPLLSPKLPAMKPPRDTASSVMETPKLRAARDRPSSALDAEGMASLFSICFPEPLPTDSNATAVSSSFAASDSPLLSASDWELRMDQLRSRGNLKMPPQPILDDVTRIVTRAMGTTGQPNGIGLGDFTAIIQRQLVEVRADMMPTAPPHASTEPLSALTPHCPAHPVYVLTVPTTLTSTNFSDRVSAPRHARTPTQGPASEMGSQWRELPTWCIALAGLFPREMSLVCPLSVVRYLRSAGLIRAVMEAILQRLQLKVDALSEYAGFVARSTDGEERAEGPAPMGDGARRGPRRGERGMVKRSPLSAPQRSRAKPLPPFLSASAIQPTSATLSVGSDATGMGSGNTGGVWQEQPVWMATAPDNTTTTTAIPQRNKKKLGRTKRVPTRSVEALTTEANPLPAASQSSTMLTASESGRVRPHYLEQRPIDPISASKVARAKARRLMDTLRRHTVPINRYECFARVEPDDEPVQEPLCFVSEGELKATFADHNDDAEESDSDAMSDMIAALTYIPEEEETAASVSRPGAMEGKGGTDPQQQRRRSSLRHPLLPRMTPSEVPPDIITGPTSTATGRSASYSTTGGLGFTSSTNGGGSVLYSAPCVPAGAGSDSAHHHPPPPVPCMFRMSGVLPTPLPRKQEVALVSRLSQPVCDPRSMSVRSASGVMTVINPVTECRTGEGSTVSSAPRASQAVPLDRKVHTHSASQARSSPPSGDGLHPASEWGGYTSLPRRQHHPPCPWKDPYCASVCSRPSQLPTAALRRPVAPSTSHRKKRKEKGDGSGHCRLTNEQNRGFFFFEAPQVLVAAPLSTQAAATAAMQVISGGVSSASAPRMLLAPSDVAPESHDTPPPPAPTASTDSLTRRAEQPAFPAPPAKQPKAAARRPPSTQMAKPTRDQSSAEASAPPSPDPTTAAVLVEAVAPIGVGAGAYVASSPTMKSQGGVKEMQTPVKTTNHALHPTPGSQTKHRPHSGQRFRRRLQLTPSSAGSHGAS